MNAYIISIGDELLIGQVINSNAAFIAEQLQSAGITVFKILTVGDDESPILEAFEESFNRADVTIVTGGLGPTHDDITKTLICKFFQTDLVLHEESLRIINDLFRKRNLSVNDSSRQQAMVPRGSTVIVNKRGTAPGILIERPGKFFFSLPGVPSEMEAMLTEFIIPYFERRGTGTVVLHKTLNTTGIPESVLAERLNGVLSLLSEGDSLAYLPSFHGVRLRIMATGTDKIRCRNKIEEIEAFIRQRADRYIYGVGNEPLEVAVGTILNERHLTLAVAESCTGGHIVNRLTNIPGSSSYVERGFIAYSNRSKIELLGVPGPLLHDHGAVSREVCEAMAQGARKQANTDIGLSVTGIAGPDGGTTDKPVGLVWIGYSDKSQTVAVKFLLGEHRLQIKERASQAALELLRRKLLAIE